MKEINNQPLNIVNNLFLTTPNINNSVAISSVKDVTPNTAQGINSQVNNLFTANTCGTGSVCSKPTSTDRGGLKVDGDVITTPGGFQIKQIGQFEWSITGTDGKTTRVWGDPHVDESDGGKWDFKRSSTFVLADGTRINVTTTPWEGDRSMTVTKKLDIINGNDRIEVTDIDKGKGKIGQVTKDGFAKVNDFYGRDVFIMANGETDDWVLAGKSNREIIGSRNGGDSFILGSELGIKEYTPTNNINWLSPVTSVNNPLLNLFNYMLKLVSENRESTASQNKDNKAEDRPEVTNNRDRKIKVLEELYTAFTNMATALKNLAEMNQQVKNTTLGTATPIKA
jgi:hypothetical protein